MRKKSHISLARYMVQHLNDEELRRHKFSFYLGSILPDIKPSFLYKRHEINGTFHFVRKRIERLSEGERAIEKKGRKYYLDLGQISHYLADYFTFPHNEVYEGSLKEHCSYEEKLKRDLRNFLKGGAQGKERHLSVRKIVEGHEHRGGHFPNAEELCDFIQKVHKDYTARRHNVEDDIHHIVEVNRMAIDGITKLLAARRAEWRLRHL